MEAMSEPFSGWTAIYFFENSTFWVKKAARRNLQVVHLGFGGVNNYCLNEYNISVNNC